MYLPKGYLRLGASLAVVGMLVLLCFCDTNKKTVSTLPYKNLSDSAHYVGKQVCRGCHADIYETFIKTGMGQSFDLATQSKTAARFSSEDFVYDKWKDLYYKPFFQRDTMKVLEYRMKGRDTVYKRLQTINYIVGSGQHTNSHMTNVNGYVYQVPITFYTQQGKWDLAPGFDEGHNTRFSRQIGLECMSCHNALPGYVKGSENKYVSISNGIDCERCHGPGNIHVEEKKQGKLVDIHTTIDYSIVNPAKLPVDYQFDICQRCHLQGNAVLNSGKSFFDFKPGMRLSEVMNVFMPLYEGNSEEHIMASHVERLKMSRCFTETMAKVSAGTIKSTDPLKPYKDAITCVTCHNPHVSVKYTSAEVFNDACRKCHTVPDNKFCSRAETKKDGNLAFKGNCVHCHMPRSGTIDIPHVTVTDHKIKVPVSETEIGKLKNWIGIKCISNPTADAATIAKGYIQYFEKFEPKREALDSAEYYIAKLSKDDLARDPSLVVYFYFVKQDYPAIVRFVEELGVDKLFRGMSQKWSNEDAWLLYRIGEAYVTVGETAKAEKFLENAVQLAPAHLQFRNKLAACALANEHVDKAKGLFESIIKDQPQYAPAYANLGFIELSREDNVLAAGAHYLKALALDPDYEQGQMNLVGLRLFQQKTVEAKEILKNIVAKNPLNAQAATLLKQLDTKN